MTLGFVISWPRANSGINGAPRIHPLITATTSLSNESNCPGKQQNKGECGSIPPTEVELTKKKDVSSFR
ncbi:hypothetical protein CRM22_009791 [Opisthorchis felineus]|uniref:Uncharacterized protein n=1 Tax=Opisthorchis felineus TaxID=147828 RepID=A0A4S2L4R2_OPIFE|nr:hypothetical protein CRM22_009791 [Opisthorchis felineus]